MSATQTPAPSKTRLRKVECLECGVICRMSRAAMQKSGLPTCGCGTPMTCSDLDDLAVVAPEDPRVREAEAAMEAFVERSVQQQHRQARRHGKGAAFSERVDLARERAYAAVKARDAEALERARDRRPFGEPDDLPF